MGVLDALVPASHFVASDFVNDVAPEDMVYFLVNVGDGDMQLVLLPEYRGARTGLIVDVARAPKLNQLIAELQAVRLLPGSSGARELFPLVCATHPHHDHIAGMGAFLTYWRDDVGEFWEPGYYHTSGSFHAMMTALGTSEVRHAQPTSGFTRYIGMVKITVLTPGIQLRNRFDTYGVNLNDASLSMKLEFPAPRVEQGPFTQDMHDPRFRTLLLGADSQMLSWAQAQIDFPQLEPRTSPVAKALHKAQGAAPLRADLLKVPHHGSKHGVSLELIERIKPRLALVSCGPGGGRYNFPHAIAVEALREARQPIARHLSVTRDVDDALGIHYTGARDSDGSLLGSIAVVISPKHDKWDLWRFGDGPADAVDFQRARRYVAQAVMAGRP